MIIFKRAETAEEIKNNLITFDERLIPSISSLVDNMDEYASKLLKNAVVLGMYEQEKLIGSAAFYCNDLESKTAFLSQIVVSEECVSRGYGSKLLKECERISKDNGMTKMKLEVYKDNTVGLAFYKKNGYLYEKDCSDKSVFMIKEI